MRSIAGWFVAALAVAGVAHAADPLVPAPQGAPMLLEVAADGVQIYACEAKGQGFEWVFKAPEANLFNTQNLQVGTHFAGPTWKADDGSTVVGEVAARADAPAGGAIPWLLLQCQEQSRIGRLVDRGLHPPGGYQGRRRAGVGLRCRPQRRPGARPLLRALPVLRRREVTSGCSLTPIMLKNSIRG